MMTVVINYTIVAYRKDIILKIIFLWLLLACFFPSQAKQERSVVGNDELLFEISQKDLTRISLTKDFIQSIQIQKNLLEIKQDITLGEAYIKPMVNRPINFFIISKKGYVYKLLVNPVDIPAEQIILNNRTIKQEKNQEQGQYSTYSNQNSKRSNTANTVNDSSTYEKHIVEIILAMQNNDNLDNCYIKDYGRKGKKVNSPIKSLDLMVKQGYICSYEDNFYGYKIQMKRNKSNKRYPISSIKYSEKDFVTKDTKAIKIYDNYLLIIQ